jgi:hypothetical protein
MNEFVGSNLMNDQQFGLNYFIDAARDLSSIATEVRELCGLVHQAVGSLKLKYGAQSSTRKLFFTFIFFEVGFLLRVIAFTRQRKLSF